MATIIKIKKSASSNAPTALATGELAYSYGSGTQSNNGDRLFIGFGTETNGEAANIGAIGGKYFTDKLDHVEGTLTANSALIVDGNSKIDTFNVDNLNLNGNTISSTSTNGPIRLTPHGTGQVQLYNGLYGFTDTIGNAGDALTYNGSNQTIEFTDLTSTIRSKISASGDISYNSSSGVISYTAPFSTATTILAAIKTVDGAGSGLDADLFDGNETSYFTNADNLSTGTVASARISGDYTGITEVGTLSGLTVASSQAVSMGSNRITNVADPISAQDAVTKAYIDATVNGLDVKESVRVTTTGNLASSYSSGVLTASSNAGLVIDGVTMVAGDRVLVKDQSNNLHNGIYSVTNIGSGAAAWVLTRTPDADTAAELTGGTFFFVEEGTNGADNGFVATHNGTPTFGSSAIAFTQFSGAGNISAGAALTKTGNTLDVEVDDSTIEVTNDALNVKSLGISNGLIANSTIDLTAKVTGILPTVNGGTGVSTFTANRMIVSSASGVITVLGAGTSGQVLMSNGSNAPAFADIDGGTY